MRHRTQKFFLVAAVVALACVHLSSPGEADQLRHPIRLGETCDAHFERFMDWGEHYKAFAYVSGSRGYACAADIGASAALKKCGELGRGKCRIYAQSPVNGKVAIVWGGAPSAIRSAYESRDFFDEGQCWEGPRKPIMWSTLRRCENIGGVLMRNSYDLRLCQKKRLSPTKCLRLLQEIDAQSEGLPNAAVMAKHVSPPKKGVANDAATRKPAQASNPVGTLIVRKFPSYDAHEIARLSPDQKLIVERETTGGWAFIKFSKDRHGYVKPNSFPSSIQRRLKKDLADRRAGEAANRKVLEQAAAKSRSKERELAEAQTIEIRRMRAKQAQTALKTLGLYGGEVDGVNGAGTRAAFDEWLEKTRRSKDTALTAEVVALIELAAMEEKNRRLAIAESNRNRVQNAARREHKHSIAVIIGNRDYTGRTPDVAYAGNDADAVRRFVTADLGYRDGNIIDLRDASLTQLNATFGTAGNHRGRLFDYVRAGKSDVIVFYSGHGVPGLRDRKGYLLPVDADPNRAELNGYPLDTLLANLAKVPARSMAVYIDACFSGESQKGLLVRATSGITVQTKVPKSSKAMVVVTAAQNDQFASWDEDAKHGLFTKHLLEALRGKADGEGYGDGDGKVTLAELRAYLDEEMTYQARRRWSRDQNASVQGASGSVLATLR
jgi:peptidoglycan hydrolase-like protein with peptidoglycan-binding domain